MKKMELKSLLKEKAEFYFHFIKSAEFTLVLKRLLNEQQVSPTAKASWEHLSVGLRIWESRPADLRAAGETRFLS